MVQVYFHWPDVLFYMCAFFPVTFFHEMGHVIAGWAVGSKGALIRYGSRKARWRSVVPLGPLRLEWNWGPGLWLTAPSCWFSSTPQSAWLRLVRVVGGPAASALLLLGLFLACGTDLAWTFRPNQTLWQKAEVVALWFTIVPLIPLRYPSGLPSDGLQIITLTRELLRARRTRTP